MGSFLYNLYTQELPSVITINCTHKENMENKSHNLFEEECSQCGVTFSFADGSTITVEGHRHNSVMVGEKMDMIPSTLRNIFD